MQILARYLERGIFRGQSSNGAPWIVRRWTRRVIFFAVTLSLAACGGLNMDSFFDDKAKPQVQQPQPGLPQSPSAITTVALLLPLTGPGDTARIAKAMKQAAELAMLDSGNPNIKLITKDTAGTAQKAQIAANEALAQGARIIVGPLLGSSVRAVSPLTRPGNIPVIAFSSVSSVAGQGTYLMSFLPEEEISNIVRYSVSQQRKNIAALIPKSTYGALSEAALNQAAKEFGANIVILEKYSRTVAGVTEPARRIAAVSADPAQNVQALLFPEGGQLLQAAGIALAQARFSKENVQLLGTGLWDDRATWNVPLASGGLFAGVSPQQVAQFESRYQKTYGTKPPRLASLAYDAMGLVVSLNRQNNGQPFSHAQITNPEGFQGVNGIFRFRANGKIQRGLAILRVTPTGPEVVAPAPRRFSSQTQ